MEAAKENVIWHKCSLGDGDDDRTFEYTHSAEKARDTIVDDKIIFAT